MLPSGDQVPPLCIGTRQWRQWWGVHHRALGRQKRLAAAESRPRFSGKVDLDLTLRMVHGDEVLATTETATFEEVAASYAQWVRSLEPAKPTAT